MQTQMSMHLGQTRMDIPCHLSGGLYGPPTQHKWVIPTTMGISIPYYYNRGPSDYPGGGPTGNGLLGVGGYDIPVSEYGSHRGASDRSSPGRGPPGHCCLVMVV